MGEEQQRIQIPRVKLGTQGLEVSKLGFGCMGLTGGYSCPVSEEVGISIIKHAFHRGITFFDTSDMYGPKTNEILVGKVDMFGQAALKQLPREKVQLATKFGFEKLDSTGIKINGTPEYVHLYYQHRVDTNTPIEDTPFDFRCLNSRTSPETIKRAHAVHPISAFQTEWSLWTRDIEDEIVPLCRELGIGIVPYSPLGRGFFGGKGVVETVPANSHLLYFPRFQGENLDRNKMYLKVDKLAEKHGCSPAQLALAWVLYQGDDVAPIPGTTKIKNLDSNIDSVKVKLTAEDLKEISDAVPINEVAGDVLPDRFSQLHWKFGNTPPKGSKVST
ncbi:hypothetical protein ES332_A11G292800v1 [Gossypium tomentosum]|uniref:NADP-dependent oxidoreductase domain-containing protein n=1 Tax=Gossypium tomentosum TaxID=34277 RepID=A0A5D2NKF9_GOSTO|nr:hypothetical protein ES332_A11G292800v1 [Gossypium tomentosum]